jgi:CheY-like chemotaxis protein
MPAGRDLRTMTVLIADDDSDMRQYLRGCLHGFGVARVLETADGANALRHARAADVDLVISDLVMPRLDGLSLAGALKADARTHHIHVLLMSGESDSPPAGTSADGFLAKPFNAAGLRRAIDLAIARPP